MSTYGRDSDVAIPAQFPVSRRDMLRQAAPAAKSLVGQTFPGEKTREALQVAADRSKISSVVVYDA